MTLRAWRIATALYVAFIGTVSGLAYAHGLPLAVLRTPYLDKVLHFVLLGGASFFARKATNDRRGRAFGLAIPLAPLVVGILATTDEIVQAFVPTRTFDLLDMAANLAGVIVFGWLAGKV
jgi:VanZ family protein